MSYTNDLLLSIALKFETTVFLDIPRDFRVFHNSLVCQHFLRVLHERMLAYLQRLTFVRRI